MRAAEGCFLGFLGLPDLGGCPNSTPSIPRRELQSTSFNLTRLTPEHTIVSESCLFRQGENGACVLSRESRLSKTSPLVRCFQLQVDDILPGLLHCSDD